MPYTIIGDIGELITADNAEMHNKCVIQTMNNCLMFCDNVTVTNYRANTPFASLPELSMYPATLIKTPILVDGAKITQFVAGGEYTEIQVPQITVTKIPTKVQKVTIDNTTEVINEVIPTTDSIIIGDFKFPAGQTNRKTLTIPIITNGSQTISIPSVTINENTIRIPNTTSQEVTINDYGAILTIQNSNLSINVDIDEGTIYLNGIVFSINSSYYTPEIGNIYNNGSSPLTNGYS